MIRVAIVLALAGACGRISFQTPNDASSGSCVTQISAGAAHTCALRSNGTVQCWGSNSFGELGDGTFVMSALPVTVTVDGAPLANITQISMGAQTNSCARRSDGTAWCWGMNTSGQLGDGTTTDRPSPVQVMAAPGVPLVDVAEVQTGEDHSCAIKSDGTVWCWGTNVQGELGIGGSPAQSLTPVQALTGATSPLVGVQGISLGVAHVVAWAGAGQLHSWGDNRNGQLGDGTSTDKSYATPVSITNVVSASAACCHTCVATETGIAYCFGRGDSGELGNGLLMGDPSPTSVREAMNGPTLSLTQIAVGDAHTCGRRDDASVWCWGDNSSGEAGIGSMVADILSPARVTLDSGAIDLAAGNNHMCAAHADGASCWGRNTNGQLGNGSLSTSRVPVRVDLDCPDS